MIKKGVKVKILSGKELKTWLKELKITNFFYLLIAEKHL